MTDPTQDQSAGQSRASKALQRRAMAEASMDGPRSLEVPGALQARGADGMPAPTPDPKGIIAGFKAQRLTRRAAIDQLTVYYDAQLEVVKARLTETVRVRKAEASLKAEEFLQILNNEHIGFLTELGLKNEDMRNRAFFQLNEQTAKMMRQVEGANWPPEMIDTTLSAIAERYSKFMRKLTADLEDR